MSADNAVYIRPLPNGRSSIAGRIKCFFKDHVYVPAFSVRGDRRFTKNGGTRVSFEEVSYQCIRCGCHTEWMSGKKRKGFLKKYKPDWSNSTGKITATFTVVPIIRRVFNKLYQVFMDDHKRKAEKMAEILEKIKAL